MCKNFRLLSFLFSPQFSGVFRGWWSQNFLARWLIFFIYKFLYCHSHLNGDLKLKLWKIIKEPKEEIKTLKGGLILWLFILWINLMICKDFEEITEILQEWIEKFLRLFEIWENKWKLWHKKDFWANGLNKLRN